MGLQDRFWVESLKMEGGPTIHFTKYKLAERRRCS